MIIYNLSLLGNQLMNLLTPFFTKANTSINGVAIDKSNVSLRARVSLVIVWSVAFLSGAFFYFSYSNAVFSQADINMHLLVFQQQQNMLHSDDGARQQPGETEAFVFVNINKKFILTHFPSGSQYDEAGTNGNGNAKNLVAEKQIPTVIRKIKTSNKKNSNSDFSIKPVPQ